MPLNFPPAFPCFLHQASHCWSQELPGFTAAVPLQVQVQLVSVTAQSVSVMRPTMKVCGSTEFIEPRGTVEKAASCRSGKHPVVGARALAAVDRWAEMGDA